MKPQDKVVLIKGDPTKWYHQAIFIINQDLPTEKIPIDFVAEAEKIIYNYMAASSKNKVPAHKLKTNERTAQNYTPLNKSESKINTAKPAQARPKKLSRADFLLNIMMICACIAIAIVFLYGMLS